MRGQHSPHFPLPTRRPGLPSILFLAQSLLQNRICWGGVPRAGCVLSLSGRAPSILPPFVSFQPSPLTVFPIAFALMDLLPFIISQLWTLLFPSQHLMWKKCPFSAQLEEKALALEVSARIYEGVSPFLSGLDISLFLLPALFCLPIPRLVFTQLKISRSPPKKEIAKALRRKTRRVHGGD